MTPEDLASLKVGGSIVHMPTGYLKVLRARRGDEMGWFAREGGSVSDAVLLMDEWQPLSTVVAAAQPVVDGDVVMIPGEMARDLVRQIDLVIAKGSAEEGPRWKEWRDVLDPKPPTLLEKIAAIQDGNGAVGTDLARAILHAVAEDIAHQPVVPNCGDRADGDGCYVKDERAAIVARLRGER